jgi:peptidoglycan/LPS O-acetylase OafA/YrhL
MSPPGAAQSEHRNPEIECLRALAILLVIVCHYPALLTELDLKWHAFAEGWWSGVDLFFCISGFVIARALVDQLADRRDTDFWRGAGAFWIRRWYRIVPAAWLWILALALFNAGTVFAGDRVFFSDALAALLNYANYHFYRCTLSTEVGCQNLHIYWSLSLEEQFYLLAPLLIWIFRRRTGQVALALAAVQIVIARDHWVGWLGFFRTDAILLGVFLALSVGQPWYRRAEPGPQALTLARGGAVLLVVLLATVPTFKPLPQYIGVVALLSAGLVWLASYDRGYLIGEGRLRTALVWIGQRSFSLYLAHILAFATARRVVLSLGGDMTAHPVVTSVLLVVAGLVLLWLAVEISYRWIEMPWRQRGRARAAAFDRPRAASGMQPL